MHSNTYFIEQILQKNSGNAYLNLNMWLPHSSIQKCVCVCVCVFVGGRKESIGERDVVWDVHPINKIYSFGSLR